MSYIDTPAVLFQYFDEGLDARAVAKLHGVSQWKILDLIKKSGRVARNMGHVRVSVLMTEHQMQVIEGQLMGDGCLSIGQSNVNATFQWGGKSHEVAEYLHTLLGPLACYCKPDRVYWKLCSRASATFTPIHARWYPNGKKIVPWDFQITPTTLLHWYIGDGSLYIRARHQPCIRIATNCFDSQSMDVLINQFKTIGLNPWREKTGHAGHGLRFSVKETHVFLDYIGGSPFVDFRYKWL